MQNTQFYNPYYIPANIDFSLPAIPQQTASGPSPNEVTQAMAQQRQAQAAQPAQTSLAGNDPFSMSGWGRFKSDIGDMGTGILYAGAHPGYTGKAIGRALGDYFSKDMHGMPYLERALKLGVDTAAFLLPTHQFNYDNLKRVAEGKASAQDLLDYQWLDFQAHPGFTALDSLVLGDIFGAGKLVRGSKFVKGLTKAADATEAGINAASKAVKSKGQYIIDEAKKLKNFDTDTIAKGVEALESASVVTDPKIRSVLKPLRNISDNYDDMVKTMSPETWVPGNRLATNQMLVRDGVVSTYAEADKLTSRIFNDDRIFKFSKKAGDFTVTTPEQGIKEIEGISKIAPKSISTSERVLTKEGEKILEDMAAKGDDIAGVVLDADRLYKKGWLRPIPHGLAEVIKDTGDVGTIARALAEKTAGAGRMSERVFGNATYEDIVKQLRQTSDWLDYQMKGMTENQLGKELAEKGTLGGINVIEQAGAKGVKYLKREQVANGKLSQALDTASDVATSADDIPVSGKLVKEMKNQLGRAMGINPFKSGTLLGNLYNIGKSVYLASGGYLIGNAQTGLYNMFMNAGLNPVNLIKDVGAAIATKGKLSKELGAFRNVAYKVPENESKILNLVQKVGLNRPLGNTFSYLDAKMQNMFAEVAANANLRSKGIAMRDRLGAIQNMSDAKLADMIKDVKLSALINPTRTVLPATVSNWLALGNPFYRWTDTAAQSTYMMYKKHPILTYYGFVKGLGDIALNQELQNRANLHVKSSKPFVTYRMNPRTGKVQELSMEFTPMMNTLKFGYDLMGGESGTIGEGISTAIPAVTALENVFKGLDRYGRPIKRPEMSDTDLQNAMVIQGDKRYKWVPGKGFVEPVGTQLDEVISVGATNLMALPNLYNKTVAPMVAGALGTTYNKPYGNAIFGTYGNEGGYGSLPLQAGNPQRSVGGVEAADLGTGIYTQDYYPEKEFTTEGFNKRAMKGIIRNRMRNMGYMQ